MRLPFCLMFVVLGFGTSADISGAAQSTAPQFSGTPGFSISISTPESSIKPETEPILDVVFTNISNHAIHLGLDEANYRLEVRDEYGELARLTAYGKKLTAGESQLGAAGEAGLLTVALQPRESAKAQINVSRLFDLSWPGKYTITVQGYDPENKAQVQSNEIGITVVQVQCPAASSAATPSMPSPPVTITLSTKHHAVEVGSQVVIDVPVTNFSRHSVGIDGYDYPGSRTKDVFAPSLVLKDPGGCPVKVRKDLRLPSGSFPPPPPPLMPGETRKGVNLLSNVYDFSQPGVYTIQEILTNQKTGQTIKSNILTITVYEGCTAYGADAYSAPTYWVEKTTRTPAGAVKRGQELYNCDIYKKNACAPVLISRHEPKYNDEARKKRLTGAVVLGFLVDSVGKTSDVHVLEPLDKGLDEQAADAVKQWRFKPALYKGETLPVQAQVAVEFGCEAARFPRKFMVAP